MYALEHAMSMLYSKGATYLSGGEARSIFAVAKPDVVCADVHRDSILVESTFAVGDRAVPRHKRQLNYRAGCFPLSLCLGQIHVRTNTLARSYSRLKIHSEFSSTAERTSSAAKAERGLNTALNGSGALRQQ